ncbi:EpsG family protein [Providencia sp. PROV254]|uniref:EpsG family protein n=1 Tax=Providencia sp. PROV254 TaxID=2949942 RepID=UPI00234B41C4|nr:EpsG family protein [Providencia sp. PROV254]
MLLNLPLLVKTKDDSTKLIYPLSYFGYFFLILFSGLRFGIGTDFFNYQTIFFNINTNSFYNSNLELGFSFLVKMLPQTEFGFQLFIFTSSLINNLLLFVILEKMIRNKKNHERLIIFIFFFITNIYFFPFNGIRQGIACAFALFSYKYILSNELSKFLLCILLGFLFHKSIVIFIPFYFLFRVKIHRNINLILVTTALLIVKLKFLNSVTAILHYIVDEKYINYIENPPDFGGSGLGVYLYIFLFSLVYVTTYLNKSFQLRDPKFNFLFFIFTLGIVLRILSLENIIFVRLSYFFTCFDFIFIPYILLSFSKNKFFWVSIYTTIYLITFLASLQNTNGLLPYNNILFE